MLLKTESHLIRAAAAAHCNIDQLPYSEISMAAPGQVVAYHDPITEQRACVDMKEYNAYKANIPLPITVTAFGIIVESLWDRIVTKIVEKEIGCHLWVRKSPEVRTVLKPETFTFDIAVWCMVGVEPGSIIDMFARGAFKPCSSTRSNLTCILR